MKSQKAQRKRNSTPSAAAGSSQMMGPWGQPVFYPWQMQAGPMFSASQPQPAKPWDSDSESDSDFETKPKKCKTFKGASKLDTDKGKKRGPGRPTKEEVDYVASVPKALNELHDNVALANDEKTCRNCLVYVGAVAIKPCGHALYCRKCVNKLRLDCVKLKKPGKCLADNCGLPVQGWVVLKNVSG